MKTSGISYQSLIPTSESLKPDSEALKKALITFVAVAAMMVFAIGLLALLQNQLPKMPFASLADVGFGGSLGMMIGGFGVAAFILGLYCCTNRKKENKILPPKPDLAPLKKTNNAGLGEIPFMGAGAPDVETIKELNLIRDQLGQEGMPKDNTYHFFPSKSGDIKFIIWKKGEAQPTFDTVTQSAYAQKRKELEANGFRREIPIKMQGIPTDKSTERALLDVSHHLSIGSKNYIPLDPVCYVFAPNTGGVGGNQYRLITWRNGAIIENLTLGDFEKEKQKLTTNNYRIIWIAI